MALYKAWDVEQGKRKSEIADNFEEEENKNNSEDICLQTLTSFSIMGVKITRACGLQKSFRAGQILCTQTNFQQDFRQVSILKFPSNFDSERFS